MIAIYKGNSIAENIKSADTFFARLRGLMFKKQLNNGQGLLLAPCYQIHTFFMFFEIDVIFMTKEGLILHLQSNLKPGKISTYIKKSGYILELPGGTIEKYGLKTYTILCLSN